MAALRSAARASVVLPLLLVWALLVPVADAVEPVPWTAPQAIPGTNGEVNPTAATAPDGTDVVLWAKSGAVPSQNVVYGKVRLPGRTAWLPLPATLKGPYLTVGAIVGAPNGDFWVLLSKESGGGAVSLLTQLSTRTQRWSTPVPLFTGQTANFHTPTGLALTGNGTLVVTASAPPKVPPPGDPVYRVAVTTKAPGGRWVSAFLSPIDKMASAREVTVNAAGDILVSFIQGYQLSTMTVWAATKPRGSSTWTKTAVSAPGDAQRTRASLAPDGTAGVVWAAPASGPFTAVRLATRNVRSAAGPWVVRDVAAGGNVDIEPLVLAGNGGRATTVWRALAGGTAPLWVRQFDGVNLGAATRVTPAGEVAELNALARVPGGTGLLVYQRFTPAIVGIASEAVTLTNGVADPPSSLIGAEATFGDTNGEQVSVDAAGHGTLVYTQGTYPATTLSWVGQVGPPVVVNSPTGGVVVTRAKVLGKTRVGKRVRCGSGYWVDTAKRVYSWTRNGHRIRGAAGSSYKLVRADAGKTVACRVVASNSTGVGLTLTSPGRRVAR